MTNHVHMAMQAHAESISAFMRFLASHYARSTNLKMGRTGHLFERRYRAMLVEADSYLLELVRYIHLNPVRAGLVQDVSEYRWSSHRAYAGGPRPEWLEADLVLSMFGTTAGSAFKKYRRFLHLEQPEPVMDLLRRGNAEDGRVLAGDSYIQQITTEEAVEPKGRTLEQIIEQFCDRKGVSVAELTGMSRKHGLADIRAEIAIAAAEAGVASIAEVARRFGRSQPALSRSISRIRGRLQADKLRML
jgi:REP element-mobilizing transposase RayT